ncbi:MAG: SLOG family protein [Rikenellaceae bacterium]
MKISPEISVAFTGNRDITPHQGLKCVDLDGFLRQALSERIQELYHDGFRNFLSGGAMGFDLLAAEVVVSLKESFHDIALVVVIPFDGQDEKYSHEDKLVYERILREASQVIVINESGYDVAAYHLRNDYMVRHASRVVAYSNGRGKGTRSTIKLAKKLGVEVENLYKTLADEVEDEQLSFDFI